MQLSVQELIFLNRMLDGKQIFGVSEINERDIEKPKTGSEIRRNLKEKNILENDFTLSPAGKELLDMLQQYKNADTYITLNHVKMALLQDDTIINAYQKFGNYCFNRITKGEFLFGMLKEFTIMRNGMFENAAVKKQMTYQMWKEKEEEIDKSFTNSVFYQKYCNGKLITAKVYYWNQNEMYRYDILRKEYKNCTGGEMRRDIFESIENVRKGV